MTRTYRAYRTSPTDPEGPGIEVSEHDAARNSQRIVVSDAGEYSDADADELLARHGFRRVSAWSDWPEGVTWDECTVERLDPNLGLTPGDGRMEIIRLCETLAILLRDPHPGLASWVEARTQLATRLHELLGVVL